MTQLFFLLTCVFSWDINSMTYETLLKSKNTCHHAIWFTPKRLCFCSVNGYKDCFSSVLYSCYFMFTSEQRFLASWWCKFFTCLHIICLKIWLINFLSFFTLTDPIAKSFSNEVYQYSLFWKSNSRNKFSKRNSFYRPLQLLGLSRIV